MGVYVYIVLLVVAMTATTVTSSTGGACPRNCFCNNQGRIIYCSQRGHLAIPDNIPSNTIELNMNLNHFQVPTIRRANFSNLHMLERLYISGCGIEYIQVDAFKDLVSLKWLDLSANHIRHIDDFTFAGITLEQLFLNGNRHVRLSTDSFGGLTTTGLYLHDCSLTHLAPEVLSPLNGTLKNLWLSGNALDRPSRRLQSLFASLVHLRLGMNPLHCNCETGWLKELFDARDDLSQGSVAPSCASPQRLRGNSFSQLTAHDFRCLAPVFNNIDTQFDHVRGRLRCTATGDPPPTLYWIRPSGEARRFAPPASLDAKVNEAMLTIDNSHTDSLSGMYICIATNDGGNVTLTVNVSWPRMNGNGAGFSYKVLPHDGSSDGPASTGSPSAAGGGAGSGIIALPGLGSKRPSVPSRDVAANASGSRPPLRKSDLNPDNQTSSSSDSGSDGEIVLGDTAGQTGDSWPTFSLTELILAIVVTHVTTALLVAIVVFLCRRRKHESSLLRYSSAASEKHRPGVKSAVNNGRYGNGSSQYTYDR